MPNPWNDSLATLSLIVSNGLIEVGALMMDLTNGWNFRPSTLDRAVYNGVVNFNEYRLPETFSSCDVVVDIGCHIGSFAHAAVTRGCRYVVGYEPDRENFAIASDHLRDAIEQGLVRLTQAAVWRSDPNDDELRFDGYHPFPESFPGMQGTLNTGNGSVIWGEGEVVPKLAFDDIIDSLTNGGQRRIRLVKLDCEGSEWPILLTSSRLHLIDEICGEFHELGGEYLEITEDRSLPAPIFRQDPAARYTVADLDRLLSGAGFTFTYLRHHRPSGDPEGLGLFFAARSKR